MENHITAPVTTEPAAKPTRALWNKGQASRRQAATAP